MSYTSDYWGGKLCNKCIDRKAKLIEQLSELVGGTASEVIVVDSRGNESRRIVIEYPYESPTNN